MAHHRAIFSIGLVLISGLFCVLAKPASGVDTQYAAFVGDLNADGTAAANRPILTSQRLYRDAGGMVPADAETSLTGLYENNSGNVIKLFDYGNIITLAEAVKGGDILDEEEFIVGTTGGTVGELLGWLEDVLGINTSLELPDWTAVVPSVDNPGVTLIADGSIKVVGNMAVDNNLVLDAGDITASQGWGSSSPGSSLPLWFSSNIADANDLADLGESVRVSFTAYDSLERELDIIITLVMQEKDDTGITWRYFAESPDDVDFDRCIGTGTIKYDPVGNYEGGIGLAITIDRLGMGVEIPQEIMLDFSEVDCFAMSSTLTLLAIDGSVRHVPGEFATIQSAIDFAFDRDTVLVEPDTYAENIDFQGKAITVKSSGGAWVTIIDGGGSGSVVTFDHEEDPNSVLEGFTVTNGDAVYGGGIFCGINSSPTIVKNVIKNNHGNFGGGLRVTGSEAALRNNVIAYNSARIGGGLYCADSEIMIDNCTISANTGEQSVGGIISNNSIISISHCIIWGNTSVSSPEILLKSNSIAAIDFSDIQDGLAGITVEVGSSINWQVGNIDIDPCFADPNNADFHLKSQGYRWDPLAEEWSYDLYSTSRCIDAGNPGRELADEYLTLEDYDPFNELGVNIRVNLGAYGGTPEAGIAPHGWALLADPTNDGIVNLADFAVQVHSWMENHSDLPGDLNRQEGVNLVDLIILSEDYLLESQTVTGNLAPSADAGGDQTITGSYQVTLDGSGSTDPDGTIVSYLWTDENGVQLAGGSNPTVNLAEGIHNLTLRVADSHGLSDSDTVTIIINQPPIAVAGQDQLVTISDPGSGQVTLSGVGSGDPDGSIVSYDWSEDGYPLVTGENPAVILAVGTHIITLTVTDDRNGVDTDTVTITIKVNDPPTADAGPDQILSDADQSGDELVSLDGSGSTDSDGSIVSYLWQEGQTELATGLNPQVNLSVGIHNITLTVIDNNGAADTDMVTVHIYPPPTADAGVDQTIIINEGNSELVTLDGSASFDPNSTIISYVWTEGDNQLATGVNPTISLELGTHLITLTVTNNHEAADTDTVIIIIHRAPIAHAGDDRIVTDFGADGELINLDGTGSFDPNGMIVSYLWSEGETQLATGPTPSVTLNIAIHTIVLTVTDDNNATDTDTVTITVKENEPPIAEAGPDQILTDTDQNGSEWVSLDATGTWDPDGNIADFLWYKGSILTPENLIIGGQTPTVSMEVGVHPITFKVLDTEGLWAIDTVTITINQ